MDWSGLEWTGVDWSRLEWTGVDWSGLELTGVTGVDWSGLEWTGVDLNALEGKGTKGKRREQKSLKVRRKTLPVKGHNILAGTYLNREASDITVISLFIPV